MVAVRVAILLQVGVGGCGRGTRSLTALIKKMTPSDTRSHRNPGSYAFFPLLDLILAFVMLVVMNKPFNENLYQKSVEEAAFLGGRGNLQGYLLLSKAQVRLKV